MAASESVGTRQSDNFLVVEAHAAEDTAQVLLVFGTVRETTVRSAESDVTVSSAWAPWDSWALHFLNGAASGESPEIRVGDPRELLCEVMLARIPRLERQYCRTFDRLEEVSRSLETSIGAMVTLWRESHG